MCHFGMAGEIGTHSNLKRELIVGRTVYFTALSVIYVIYRRGIPPLLGTETDTKSLDLR